ncbi:MAG: preprotein translocase subunit YajC [Clostridiales bacterium]|nr:preprotein translocase subunit YajC [Clostridiales bacterium]
MVKSGELIVIAILLILVVGLFVMSYMKRKKYNQELGAMRQELKKGDKVMTDSGVVGEVVETYTEEEYTYVVLKSGKDKNVGYFTVHANAIYYVFGKENAQQKTVVKVQPKEEKKAEVVEKKEDKKESSEIKEDKKDSEESK